MFLKMLPLFYLLSLGKTSQRDNRNYLEMFPNLGSDRKPIPKLNLGIIYFQGRGFADNCYELRSVVEHIRPGGFGNTNGAFRPIRCTECVPSVLMFYGYILGVRRISYRYVFLS